MLPGPKNPAGPPTHGRVLFACNPSYGEGNRQGATFSPPKEGREKKTLRFTRKLRLSFKHFKKYGGEKKLVFQILKRE